MDRLRALSLVLLASACAVSGPTAAQPRLGHDHAFSRHGPRRAAHPAPPHNEPEPQAGEPIDMTGRWGTGEGGTGEGRTADEVPPAEPAPSPADPS